MRLFCLRLAPPARGALSVLFSAFLLTACGGSDEPTAPGAAPVGTGPMDPPPSESPASGTPPGDAAPADPPASDSPPSDSPPSDPPPASPAPGDAMPDDPPPDQSGPDQAWPVRPRPADPPPLPQPQAGDPNPPIADNDFRPAGYSKLLIRDEFDGDTLNRDIWCTRMPWGGGPALQVGDDVCTRWYGQGFGDYANITENQRFRDRDSAGQPLHVVSGGTLKLRASRVADHFYTRFEAAALRSKTAFKPTANQSYYITARVKMPDVLGTWPALFLVPSLEPAGNNQWPPEIDILEGPLNGNGGTDAASMTQHAQVRANQTDSTRSEWTYVAPGFDTTWGFYTDAVSLRESWIEVGAEWTQTGVCYFLDGLKTACEKYRWVNNDNAPGNPASLIAYLAIGGPWAGANGIDEDRFPVQFEIDHIRVYQGDGTFTSSPGAQVLAMSPSPPPRDPVAERRPVPAIDAVDDYAALGYVLVYAQEFDGSELDRDQWCTRLVDGGGPPLQVPDAQCTQSGHGTADFALASDAQRFRDTNSAGLALHDVSGGTLKLRATRTATRSETRYEAAAIRSKQLFRPGNGTHHYVTARVKLPAVRGTQPAFMLRTSHVPSGSTQWPPQISIFDAPLNNGPENQNTLIQSAQLDGPQTLSGQREFNYVGPGFQTEPGYHVASDSLRNRWLEIGIEWTEGHVCYFVNGRPTACENYWWFNVDGRVANPASLIMYLAVGGPLAGKDGVDDAQMPAQLEVDWIRVYRRDGF